MPRFVRRDFLHVHGSDGDVDSICMRCLVSVGTEGTETQVAVAEIAHVCPGFNFARLLHPEAYLRQLGMSSRGRSAAVCNSREHEAQCQV